MGEDLASFGTTLGGANSTDRCLIKDPRATYAVRGYLGVESLGSLDDDALFRWGHM